MGTNFRWRHLDPVGLALLERSKQDRRPSAEAWIEDTIRSARRSGHHFLPYTEAGKAYWLSLPREDRLRDPTMIAHMLRFDHGIRH